MTGEDEAFARLDERDRVMRQARDEILRRVGEWIVEQGFTRKGRGVFVRDVGGSTCHLSFLKLRSGRAVRVMCCVERDGERFDGPWSDRYARAGSPTGVKYFFRWSTRESDIARSTEQYRRHVAEVVFPWFDGQVGTD